MKQHVTVIPSDRVIIVEGAALFFDFAAPSNLHALQWHGGQGHMEFTDDLNHPLTGQDYADDVLPFVQLWEAEKARQEAEANRPPTLAEAKEKAVFMLREKRKAIEYGGVEIEGVKWDSAEKDELRLNSVMKLFEKGTIQSYDNWKVGEGVYLTLTPQLLEKASLAFMLHYGGCFAVEAAKLAEISALTSAAAVEQWLQSGLDAGW